MTEKPKRRRPKANYRRDVPARDEASPARRKYLVDQWLWVEQTEDVSCTEFAKEWGIKPSHLTAWVREQTGRGPLRPQIAETSVLRPRWYKRQLVRWRDARREMRAAKRAAQEGAA